MNPVIHPIRAFTDNYIWAFTDPAARHACVVDPGDAAPVMAYLAEQNLVLTHILLTHHHPDHTGGVKALCDGFDITVFGPSKSPYPHIDHRLQDGDQLRVLGYDFEVMDVPGHTLDHIAYFCEADPIDNTPLVFCGDTLFAAGCGRIFEGNPPMMYQSLQRLASLPAKTRVYCTHEYTLANLRFARAADPANPALASRVDSATRIRRQDQPTLPSSIGDELATNPFLRCEEADLIEAAKQHAGTDVEDPVQVFATLRRWKDNF